MQLNLNQLLALERIQHGGNHFITGKSGAGKTTLIKAIVEDLPNVILCAPTGSAARLIGGFTVHRMFQIPPYPVIDFTALSPLGRLKRKLLKQVETVIIDEVSMLRGKYLPFFEANLDEDTYWNLYDELETGTADIQPFLDEHPELIALLPIHELWSMQADERLQLLIHHPEEADILKQTLEGNDIWAISLPMLTPAIQKKAAALCPWKTLTVSQKRYMALKSSTLKKIISEL